MNITSAFQPIKYNNIKHLQDINKNNTVLVHMTNYLPKDGQILSCKNSLKDANGISPYRNTVHFSINHVVPPTNTGQSWGNHNIGIIAPFNKVMDTTPQKDIIGGQFNDFYFHNGIKLPEGSVIVRKSNSVPSGKLKIINAEKLEEFKNTKGLTVVETSDNIKDITNDCIEKMGYSRLDKVMAQETNMPVEFFSANPIEQRKPEFLIQSIKNLNKIQQAQISLKKGWENFANENNLETYPLHSTSPYGRADALIESTNILSGTQNNWKVGNTNYKKEFIQIISEIKNKLSNKKQLDYDIDKFKTNIIESNTPKEALDRLADEQKIKGIIDFNQQEIKDMATQDFQNNSDINYTIDQMVGINPFNKILFNN